MVGNKCVIVLSLLAISGALAKNGKLRRDWEPKYQHDPSTAPYCSWWYDNDGSITCKDIPASWDITLDYFRRWVGGFPILNVGFLRNSTLIAVDRILLSPRPVVISSRKGLIASRHSMNQRRQ